MLRGRKCQNSTYLLDQGNLKESSGVYKQTHEEDHLYGCPSDCKCYHPSILLPLTVDLTSCSNALLAGKCLQRHLHICNVSSITDNTKNIHQKNSPPNC